MELLKANLEVLLAPAEFDALAPRDLRETVCVVFDVLRATSSMITALAHGAHCITPVSEIPDALLLREKDPQILLAGERGGLRIEGHLTGTIAFDVGNSPREFTASRVRGRHIAISTTNGTRALRACANAHTVLVASFLNLEATAAFLLRHQPRNLLVICGGTYEQAAYEDVLGAGALCDSVWDLFKDTAVADSAMLARTLYELERADLKAALGKSRNGQRLLRRPELADDVAFCAQLNPFDVVAVMNKAGQVRLMDKS